MTRTAKTVFGPLAPETAAAKLVTQSAARQVRMLPVGDLRPSPWNARKTFDEASIAELADSIAKHGVVVPLTVRQTVPFEKDAWAPYEIVCGHRRYLAAIRAGLHEVPCEIRELTEDEAREIGLVDNLQREDVPAMEEAEGYGKLLERPGATIETVAAALAKSPSYVGRRVQLLKAIAPVREALKHGAIEVGHALELARLDEARQRQMLSRMGCGATLVEPNDVEDEEGEPEWRPTNTSVVELRRQIARTSFVVLADAPFPLDAHLDPLPCTDCPKRAGNAQLLFDDCAQDTCTDRVCYEQKVLAWIDGELAAAKTEKRKLLKLSPNYSSDKTVVETGTYGGYARVFGEPGECEHGEEGIWINGDQPGHRAAVCRKADCKKHFGSSSGRSSFSRSQSTPAEKQKRKDLLERVRVEKAYRAALFEKMAKIDARALAKTIVGKLATGLTLFAIGRSDSTRYSDLAAAMGLDKDAFGYSGKEKLRKHLDSLAMEQRLLFARMAIEDSELCVHEHDVPGGSALNKRRKLDLEELAETVGVSWQALLQNSAPVSKAKPVAAAKKEAPKAVKKGAHAKRAALSAAARRQRIAEAQKKRWVQLRKTAAKKGGER